ncbi:MAG: DUF262 domain-containing HNH endonuclease family protein [Caulobacterales bacterium]
MANHGFGETPIGLVSQILNLASILTRPLVLRMPPFQRPYTWTVKEVSQLIDDLMEAFEQKASSYFIGQIVFVRGGRDFADVCDGQQRLTTMTILFAYARDRLAQHAQLYQSLIMSNESTPRLRPRPGDARFFFDWVQTPGRFFDLLKLKVFESDAQESMAEAAHEISEALGSIDNRQLDAFIRYIARCATFNVIDADEPGGAATVFETMNHRGQVLSGADILKGVLLASKELSPDEVTRGAALWEQKEDRAGRDNFERLLRYIPMLVRSGPIIAPGDVAALMDTISKRIGVKRFLFEVLPLYCEAHREIYRARVSAGTDSADVNRRIRCLQLIDCDVWEPLAIAYLVAHRGNRENAQRFFALYERFTAASLLNVIDPRTRKRWLENAWKDIADDKALIGPKGHFEMNRSQKDKLFERISQSSARDKLRRYIVLRVNAALGEVLTVYDDATVEHIMPARPTDEWRQGFPDQKVYNIYTHSIANYTLLTQAQNDVCGTLSYAKKRAIYFSGGEPVRALTRDIEGVLEWTPRVMDERQERLCSKMNEDWSFF